MVGSRRFLSALELYGFNACVGQETHCDHRYHAHVRARTPLTSKIAVLFIHTATRPPLGADTWVQSQIISGLDKSRHDVHVACARGTADEPTPTFEVMRVIPGIRIVPVNFGQEQESIRGGKVATLLGSLPSPASFVKLVIHARRHRIDVIHTTDRPRDAFLSVIIARLVRATCIIHTHVGFDATWMSKMLQWSLRRANGLIAISDYVASTLVAGGHDPARVHVVLNAIDIARWNPGVGRDERRQELGYSPGDTVVITVCRLFASKGPSELLRAFAIAHAGHADLRLLVVGIEMQQGFLSELTQLAADLGVDGRVVFTGQRNDVPSLMAAADIFAMPSRGEPFGLVYLEAMATQLPVVALNDGGTPEVVTHGLDGLLCEPDDIEGLAANLTALIDDPEQRRRLGRHGREQVESRFSIERMARDTEAVYRLLALAATRRS